MGFQGLPIVDCGLDYGRGLLAVRKSWEVLGSPTLSIYIEGQEPAQRIISSSNSTLFSVAHTITHILVISSAWLRVSGFGVCFFECVASCLLTY